MKYVVFPVVVLKLYRFQVDAKALGDVEYVDVIMGTNEVFLRCSTPAAAEQVVSNAPWQQVEILRGKFLDHIDPSTAEYFLANQQTPPPPPPMRIQLYM
jgi:hypothetical protein